VVCRPGVVCGVACPVDKLNWLNRINRVKLLLPIASMAGGPASVSCRGCQQQHLRDGDTTAGRTDQPSTTLPWAMEYGVHTRIQGRYTCSSTSRDGGQAAPRPLGGSTTLSARRGHCTCRPSAGGRQGHLHSKRPWRAPPPAKAKGEQSKQAGRQAAAPASLRCSNGQQPLDGGAPRHLGPSGVPSQSCSCPSTLCSPPGSHQPAIAYHNRPCPFFQTYLFMRSRRQSWAHDTSAHVRPSPQCLLCSRPVHPAPTKYTAAVVP